LFIKTNSLIVPKKAILSTTIDVGLELYSLAFFIADFHLTQNESIP
jgi:hypothetical protein